MLGVLPVTWPVGALWMMAAACHTSEEVVTRATQKQSTTREDRSEMGAVDQSRGVGEEARMGPVRPLRSTEGQGQSQLMARWAQQPHHSLAQACPKTGAPGRVVWLLLPVTQALHRARAQAPCGRPPPRVPLFFPSGHLQRGPLWTAKCSW